MARRLAAIMAADVVGFSRLMAADDGATLADLQSLRADVFNPALDAHGGRLVKLMGDGALAEFPSVVEAVRCAQTVQTRLAGGDWTIRLRIGINLGDVIADGDDIYGDGVNVAARIEALGEPGGVCVSGIVHASLSGKDAEGFVDGGPRQVKNIDRPIQVWHWRPSGANASAGEPVAPAPGRAVGGQAPIDVNRPTIMVAGFDCRADDADLRDLAEGLAGDLATMLAKRDTIAVLSPGAAPSAASGAASGAAGRGNSDYVIDGRVRGAGGRARINVQLVDRRTGAHLWADRFEAPLDDVFDLQDSVAQQIVTEVEVLLCDGEQVKLWHREAGDPRAYDEFLAGRAAYKDYSRAANRRARDRYQAALDRAPGFVSAMAGLARTHIEDAAYGWTADRERSISLAGDLLDRALAMAPDHALARAERAHWLFTRGDLRAAKQEGLRAVATDPNLADALHVLATVLVGRGGNGGAKVVHGRGGISPLRAAE